MDNILESIKELIKNNELKNNFITEFNDQVNLLEDGDEKWLNYKTFLKDEEVLDIFKDYFDINFIEKQIIGYINTSNINIDNIYENLPQFIDTLFLKRCINGLNESERNTSIELINSLGNLIQQSFFNNYYNESSKLYQGFINNAFLFNLVFYLILCEIKKINDYNKTLDIKNIFGNLLNISLFQFYSFYNENKDIFYHHILIISIIGIFIENSNEQVNLRTYNGRNLPISKIEVFNFPLLIDEKLKGVLVLIKHFNLTYTFLRKLENNRNINIEYKKKVLLGFLEYGIYDKSELVDFSILFTKYEEVNLKYIEIIKDTTFEDGKILENLSDLNNGLLNDTINFLLLEKKYINENIKTIFINIFNNILIEKLTLDEKLYLIYEYLLINNTKLNIKLKEIKYDFIDEILKDIKPCEVTLKNIGNFLVSEDIKEFYYLIIRKYIEKMSSGESFKVSDINAGLFLDINLIKNILNKIVKEGDLIKLGSEKISYEVL